MAMPVQDIQAWLNTLPHDAAVGVNDGGLCLEVVDDPDTWLEIGGIPLPDGEED